MFAAQALIGLVGRAPTIGEAVRAAYDYAEAMLNERARRIEERAEADG